MPVVERAREKKVYERFYRAAGTDLHKLPWHREEPPALLLRAASQRKPGRALDMGCGTGAFSVYLARMGYQVTALDFVAEALALARDRAARENVSIEFVEADAFSWKAQHLYDIVLDSGCFHSFAKHMAPAYRDALLPRLAPGADYVLAHFGKRHRFDWRPIGPRRRTADEIRKIFTPPLIEKEHEETTINARFPIGPTVLIHTFWFSRRA